MFTNRMFITHTGCINLIDLLYKGKGQTDLQMRNMLQVVGQEYTDRMRKEVCSRGFPQLQNAPAYSS